jgi:serine/threonine-protein kinase RsbW
VEIKMVLYLPRDAASVPVSRQILDGCLETLGVTPETRTDIALALSEACANVILHATQTDEYEVLARAIDGRCVIEVVNKGGAAIPAARPAPLADHMVPGDGMMTSTAEHGRGLKIMDAVVDNLRLTGGREGTTVHFEKALDWVSGAAGAQLFTELEHRPDNG